MTGPATDLSSLAELLGDDEYAGYAYAYPHKTSYCPLDPPVPIADAWAEEDRDALFLYTHVPFCEMRCGFCNLFTAVGAGGDLVTATVQAIREQAHQVAAAVAPQRVARAAFGGGTPSFLDIDQIIRLFEVLAEAWPVDWQSVPTSFEVSPATVDPTKLGVLRELGVNRISMGVQSFATRDLKALARPQRTADVDAACAAIAEAGFELFNLDLIYGMAGQSVDDWLSSLGEAIARGGNELYLYPLYVRELTGLGRTGRRASDHRRHLYRVGRDLLLDAGFEQLSMRHFRRAVDVGAPSAHATDYSCQDDGMVGLGPGARSYTAGLHYSTEYAVGQPGVLDIIEDFCDRSRHDVADYGVVLDESEQQRRYIIKGLLQSSGLDQTAFEHRFGMSPVAAVPDLAELLAGGFTQTVQRAGSSVLQLTDVGVEHSDAIGPWLYSPEVKARMARYELR